MGVDDTAQMKNVDPPAGEVQAEPTEDTVPELDEEGAWVSPEVLSARNGNAVEFGKDLDLDDNNEE